MTSFDCIRKLKFVWKRKDLGHGGPLDKFATGLLPVLIGDGLKLVRFFLENHPDLPTWWKTYTGTMELGRSTVTGDPEGETLETKPVGKLTREKIEAAMQTFVGVEYRQTPPAYSAKKIDGERASEIARKGETPDLKPVKVLIREFTLIDFGADFIRFSATCSKGTYIRVLAQDLAEKLETVSFVKTLERTAVGNFTLNEAITLEEVLTQNDTRAALTLEQSVSFLPRFELSEDEERLTKTGRVADLLVRLMNSGLPAGSYCAWKDKPIALLELTPEKRANFLRAFSA